MFTQSKVGWSIFESDIPDISYCSIKMIDLVKCMYCYYSQQFKHECHKLLSRVTIKTNATNNIIDLFLV